MNTTDIDTHPPTPSSYWSLVRKMLPYISRNLSHEDSSKQGKRRAAIVSPDKDVNPTTLVNYPLTIKHGFQFRSRLAAKHPVVAAIVHEKAPRHREDGHWEDALDESRLLSLRKDAAPKGDRDSAIELMDPRHSNAGDHGHSSTIAKDKKRQYTCTVIESNKMIRSWDHSSQYSATPKPRFVAKVQYNVMKVIYLARYSVYATPRFDHLQTHKTNHHIQFLAYNARLNQLIAVSSHVVTMWGIKAFVNRGSLTLEVLLQHSVEINLPGNEWITNVTLDEASQYLYVMVNTKVLVYECSTCMEVDSWLQVSTREVTSIVRYQPYGFTIVGNRDGSVKILNTSNAQVHEFQSHYKAITSLAVYPFGPVIIATALDKSVRMYNLSTFKEVYCFYLRELPLNMYVPDDASLCIVGKEDVTVWNLNHLNSGFCSLNAQPITISSVESIGTVPTRILVRSNDDVIRLISPATGKILTTCLPLFEMDTVVQAVYSRQSEKMFLLIETGEIWIIGSTHNPCVVLDIWRSTGENITILAVVEGMQPHMGLGLNPNRRKSICGAVDRRKSIVGHPRNSKTSTDTPYSVLISGTSNGQILVYNLVGEIAYRQQLHQGKVTCIASDIEQNIIVTAGEDKTMNVSVFNPAREEVISVRISIETESVVRLLSIGLEHICVGYDDCTAHIYRFDLSEGTSSQLPPHNKSDDHGDTLTSICGVKKLGLFVTSSLDATIKVWDLTNNLVRELQFHHPISSIAVSNRRGDLLLDMETRVDVISYSAYLPPQYVKTVENLKWDTDDALTAEDPIPFAEHFNFSQNFAKAHHPEITERAETDMSSLVGVAADDDGPGRSQNLFTLVNFAVDAGTEKAIKMRLRSDALKRRESTKNGDLDRVYEQLMRKLALVMERRRKIVESAKKRIELENLEIEQRENVMHEEFEKYQHYQQVLDLELTRPNMNRFQKQSFQSLTEIDNDIDIDTYNPYDIFNEDALEPEPSILPSRIVREDEIEIVEAVTDNLPNYIWDGLVPGTPEALECASDTTESDEDDSEDDEHDPALNESQKEKNGSTKTLPAAKRDLKLKIAPDGELPNSIINTNIKEWRDQHPEFLSKAQNLFDAVRMAIRHKSVMKGNAKAEADAEEAKKAAFKLKIQEMLKKKQEDERLEEEKAANAERMLLEEGAQNGEHGSNENLSKPQVKQRIAPIKPVVIQAPPKQKFDKYPRILEVGMAYSWFPLDEVFYPLIEKVNLYIKKDKKKEEELRKLRIEPNSEQLTPIILETFKNQSAAGTKLQVFQYLTWMFEQFGSRDTTSIVRFFCKFLQKNPYMDLESDELMLRELILSYLPKFGLGQIELMPTILMQLLCPIQSMHDRAMSALDSIGLFEDYQHRLLPKLKSVTEPVEATLQNEAQALREAKAQTPSKQQLLAVRNASFLTPNRRNSSVVGMEAAALQTGGGSNSSLVASTANQQQSPSVMELRNLIMTWLRKILRRYLLRTAKDDETVMKLRELNESGLVDRTKDKKALEEKEKEDAEILALREKEIGKAAKSSSMTIASSTLASMRSLASVRNLAPIPKKGGSKLAARSSVVQRKSTTDEKKGDQRKSVVMAGKQGPRTSITMGAPPSKKIEAKRSKSASSIEVLVQHPVVAAAPVVIQRNALITLQTPTISEFITVLNLLCISTEHKAKREERDYLERMAREARLAEEMQKKKDEMEAMAEYIRQREEDRLARAQMIRDKLAAKELAKQAERDRIAAEDAAAEAKKNRRVFKGFTGGTHMSKCHPSRETLDNTFFFNRHARSLGTTMLSNHFQTLHRTMPIEHVQLDPFSGAFGASPQPEQHVAGPSDPSTDRLRLPSIHRRRQTPKPPKLPLSVVRTPSKQLSVSDLSSWKQASFNQKRPSSMWEDSDSADYNDVETMLDLDYIRGSVLPSISLEKSSREKAETDYQDDLTGDASYMETENDHFQSGRKYFVMDLAEPEHTHEHNDGHHHGHSHSEHGDHGGNEQHTHHGNKGKVKKRKSKITAGAATPAVEHEASPQNQMKEAQPDRTDETPTFVFD
ncbi:hypothetical protein HDU78_007261 [Chytriomyces hyalinus]|nr:hypothetical protein HDU78_007261 [Chytriomyces hyalinus]